MASVAASLLEFRNFHTYLKRIEKLLGEEALRLSFQQWSMAKLKNVLSSIRQFEEKDISQVLLLLNEVTPDMFFEG
jgi:hypothetical protein